MDIEEGVYIVEHKTILNYVLSENLKILFRDK